MRRITLAVLAAAVVATPAWPQTGPMPFGWYKAGSKPDDYIVGLDDTVKRSGGSSAFVKAKTPQALDFATLMQTIDAEPWRGKRVRLVAYLKLADVAKSAVIWMRIDGRDRSRPLGFDNMSNRGLRGTAEWSPVEVVLDVLAEAVEINFGIMLSGAGQVWADDLSFEAVSDEVPTTGSSSRFPSTPLNLNFERRPGS